MKKIFQKNYIILVVLLVVTIFLTLFLANIYVTKNKLVSNFYEYSNKITIEEFDEYMLENPDTIIYISDKYDLTHESFESKFEAKINNFNLKEKLIFIDKKDINNDFLNKIGNRYGINIELNNTPIIIVIIDKIMIKSMYVQNNSNVDTIIDYEVFK